MKKLFCLFLSLLLAGALCACGGGQSDNSVQESSDLSETPASLTINGKDISQFRVVYKSSDEHLQYKTIAVGFVDYVRQTFGVELDYCSDLLPEIENEIIFGISARRTACKDIMKDYSCGEYKILVNGGSAVIAAGYVTGCAKGYEVFLDMINSKKGVLTDCEVSGETDVVKVACVGDSITQGINSDDRVNMNYPAYLQDMLGSDYYVLNAGLSGYSIVKTDEYAYCKATQYKEALALVPDVVIFALGTNDANPTPSQPYKNWDNPENNREELFLQSTRELLDSFKAVNPDVQIYICLPSAVFKVGADSWDAANWTANITAHSLPLLKQLAGEYNCPTIDMFEWSKSNQQVFVDGLHPKNETYKTYAEQIYNSIKDTIKKP